MNHLLNLQAQFQSYLLQDNHQIENDIVTTATVSAQERLNIYAEAYRLRLLDALESAYPALKQLLGDNDFYQLGHDYLDAYPSTFRSIRWFGDQMPGFLLQYYADKPYLAELAKVEWTMSLVFDAKDSPVLTVEDITSISAESWQTLAIEFVPSFHSLSLSWNTISLWQAMTDNEKSFPLERLAEVEMWAFWRTELMNQYVLLMNDEAQMMNHAGLTFATLCEKLSLQMNEEQAVVRAAGLLRRWIDFGMIKK